MKTYLLFLLYLLAISCNPDRHFNEYKPFNQIKNSEELFGIFDLKLGVTSPIDLKKSYKQQVDWILFERPLNLNYFTGFYHASGETEKVFEVENQLEKNNRIKQYYFSDYVYNNLTINGVSLFFLDNILVGIYIEYGNGLLSSDFNIITDFIGKYGDGIGFYKYSYDEIWSKKDKQYVLKNSYTIEERKWKNNKIEVYYNGHSLLYKLRGKYEEFDSLIKNIIEEESIKFDNKNNLKIKSSI